MVQSLYSWTVEEKKPSIPQMHIFFSDIIHWITGAGEWGSGEVRGAPGEDEGEGGAEAELTGVTTESVLFGMIFPLIFSLPLSAQSVRVSLDCVLLCRSLLSG